MDDLTEEQIIEQLEEICAINIMVTKLSTRSLQFLKRQNFSQRIQRLFRSYRVRHALHQTVPSLRSPMVIYYSSLPYMKMISDSDKLFQMLNHKRIRYFKLDLVDNKMAQTWVKDQLPFFDSPFVKIHDVFIGGYDEVKELISIDVLDEIMEKENKYQALIIEKHPQIKESESDEDEDN